MIVEACHPLDTAWDIERPDYLVYFWSTQTSLRPLGRASTFLHCREFRLRDAEDVNEVLNWVKLETRPDESVVIEIELSRPPGAAGTVRLLGHEPEELYNGPGATYTR